VKTVFVNPAMNLSGIDSKTNQSFKGVSMDAYAAAMYFPASFSFSQYGYSEIPFVYPAEIMVRPNEWQSGTKRYEGWENNAFNIYADEFGILNRGAFNNNVVSGYGSTAALVELGAYRITRIGIMMDYALGNRFLQSPSEARYRRPYFPACTISAAMLSPYFPNTVYQRVYERAFSQIIA
jgi:hypothetical protein